MLFPHEPWRRLSMALATAAKAASEIGKHELALELYDTAIRHMGMGMDMSMGMGMTMGMGMGMGMAGFASS